VANVSATSVGGIGFWARNWQTGHSALWESSEIVS